MRVRKGAARRRAKKRIFREVRGSVMGRHKLFRTAKESILKSRQYAWAHRRLKKREFRSLWIIRITAACRARGISYSSFIHGLSLAKVDLNRKMLSETAIHTPEIFDELVALSKAQVAKAA